MGDGTGTKTSLIGEDTTGNALFHAEEHASDDTSCHCGWRECTFKDGDKHTWNHTPVKNYDAKSQDELIISHASCSTNCLAPFVKVLDQKFGIIKGTMTTTHSYTGDQRLLDASHRDLRRARAAALNIVPTSTGAAKAVALVLPSLKGKLNGIALRVPTPNVSVVDLVVQVSKKTFAEEVNAAFRETADNELKGILSVCDEPLVSVDFRCSDVSSTVDASLTMVMGDDMVKVIAWYDNEWGYSQRVVDQADIVAAQYK